MHERKTHRTPNSPLASPTADEPPQPGNWRRPAWKVIWLSGASWADFLNGCAQPCLSPLHHATPVSSLDDTASHQARRDMSKPSRFEKRNPGSGHSPAHRFQPTTGWFFVNQQFTCSSRAQQGFWAATKSLSTLQQVYPAVEVHMYASRYYNCIIRTRSRSHASDFLLKHLGLKTPHTNLTKHRSNPHTKSSIMAQDEWRQKRDPGSRHTK